MPNMYLNTKLLNKINNQLPEAHSQVLESLDKTLPVIHEEQTAVF